MITLHDGPGRGQRFNLQRAPRFLRVVECGGKWDALDLLEDEPKAQESLHVYELFEGPFRAFVRRAGGGGLCIIATYRHLTDQPADDVMRARETWREWCERRAKPISP